MVAQTVELKMEMQGFHFLQKAPVVGGWKHAYLVLFYDEA